MNPIQNVVQDVAATRAPPARCHRRPSTFLPLGRSPSLIEECVALNGWTYRWHLPTGRSWRYPPAA